MAATGQPISVLEPLMVSAAMSVVTILVHVMVLIGAAALLRRKFRQGLADIRFPEDVRVTASIALLALAAHFAEIAIWAVALVFCGEFTRFSTAFYHSAMNYTSLGYGDVVMSPSWKLLGPIEAAIGLLMFGISTATIFAVMQQLLRPNPPMMSALPRSNP
ncbi:MAG TPA: potassium channel family protein [Rhizomicrobium sp.]|nr:potassium channel family protein [Rhizomicrobium sp.]